MTDDELENYYKDLMGGLSKRMNNPKAIQSYGNETESSAGKGTKNRVITTKAMTIIQLRMLAKLEKDIIENSRFSWVFGSVLPSKSSTQQPLGEYPKQ